MSKILYAEDNEDNIYVTTSHLTKAGYNVILAKNGLEVVNMAKSEKPELILMDVGLPIIDGFQATKILKADFETNKIPIVMLTAHVLVTDQEKAKECGAEDFETKPINTKSLLATIAKYIK